MEKLKQCLVWGVMCSALGMDIWTFAITGSKHISAVNRKLYQYFISAKDSFHCRSMWRQNNRPVQAVHLLWEARMDGNQPVRNLFERYWHRSLNQSTTTQLTMYQSWWSIEERVIILFFFCIINCRFTEYQKLQLFWWGMYCNCFMYHSSVCMYALHSQIQSAYYIWTFPCRGGVKWTDMSEEAGKLNPK